jgi:hypothetical protein
MLTTVLAGKILKQSAIPLQSHTISLRHNSIVRMEFARQRRATQVWHCFTGSNHRNNDLLLVQIRQQEMTAFILISFSFSLLFCHSSVSHFSIRSASTRTQRTFTYALKIVVHYSNHAHAHDHWSLPFPPLSLNERSGSITRNAI